MTAPRVALPTWPSLVWVFLAAMVARIGWDLIGWLLDALAGRVG
jgi:hypothetical protein